MLKYKKFLYLTIFFLLSFSNLEAISIENKSKIPEIQSKSETKEINQKLNSKYLVIKLKKINTNTSLISFIGKIHDELKNNNRIKCKLFSYLLLKKEINS